MDRTPAQAQSTPIKWNSETRHRDSILNSNRKYGESGRLEDATVELHGDGRVHHISTFALRMLEMGPVQAASTSFFSHIHPLNQFQVMKDVSDTVFRSKPRASWLVRLRTGRNRWRWNRLKATPRYDAVEDVITFSVLVHGLIDEYPVST